MIQQRLNLVWFFMALCTGMGSCVLEHTNPPPVVSTEQDNPLLKGPQPFVLTMPMAKVEGGQYVPLYGKKGIKVKVNPFYMDVYPVSQTEYLAFIGKNVKWKKSGRKNIFSDGNYLNHWESDTVMGSKRLPNAPVTNVSWFAAKAYCECQGKRLPTVDEWEYAAMANETMPDARRGKAYNQRILDWYEKPQTFLNPVGQTFKNYWGIYDLHGLVWEWTSDFNSVLLTGESRNDVSTDKGLFCGGGSLNATDLMNYAAFMRYALRGSVKANYCVQNLGFRCVKDSVQ